MENEPLANKIRPRSLEEFVGQEHLLGEGQPLKEAILGRHLMSFILWGPPGVGKTTLARIYAQAVNAEYFELSAVSAGKDDIKKILQLPALLGRPKILFLDEIHRFNKAQQDYLLPFVENGTLYLIGATTENPSFEVISALLSRCRVFTLRSLSEQDILSILARAQPTLPKEAGRWLAAWANGDARQALALLENAGKLYGRVTVEILKKSLQTKSLRYDRAGEEHYNTISAFIKSMRGSRPDAALYYLARMIESGEDPIFIARRMVIFASEDIGLAQPTALVVANAVFRACETVGLPECAINLAHGAAYLSRCAKDRSAYEAYQEAAADAETYGNLEIPLRLRNAPTKLMRDLGYGNNQNGEEEDFLPKKLQGKKYFGKK